MDTINTMAQSAAKAVWGENNKPTTEEPVSGRLGDTSKGEPYDAGNIEPQTEPRTTELRTTEPRTTEPRTTEPQTETIGADTGKEAHTDIPYDDEPNYTHSSRPNNDEFTTEHKSEREVEGESDITSDAKFAKNTGTAVVDEDTPSNPSTERKAASVPADTSKGQGDTRSPEDPNTHPKSAPTDVNDTPAEDGINEAQDLEGPGPKPLAEVAKERGGDAGNDSSSSVDSAKKSPDELSATGEEKHEGEKGTGEKVVHASGLKADGGDFDAANAGAGQEADRIMEEKGIHTSGKPSNESTDDASPTSGKKSLGQKIKDKLHRH